MSKIIASAAIRGAHKIAKEAEDILTKAIKEKGEDCQVEFPNTGYYMPIIYSMTGMAVEKLSDFKEVMQEIKGLLPPLVNDDLWVPYLGHALVGLERLAEAVNAYRQAVRLRRELGQSALTTEPLAGKPARGSFRLCL